ncbi:MAG: penicillin-binding protein 2 [bacterium]
MSHNTTDRLSLAFELFLLAITVVVARLIYWQLIKGGELKIQAAEQHAKQSSVEPKRGTIKTADGYPLVFTTPTYSVVEYKPQLKDTATKITDSILPLLNFEIKDPVIATDPAQVATKIKELQDSTRLDMLDKLNTKNWAILAKGVTIDEKQQIENLKFPGIAFEESFVRGYPEASMSAHVIGFVGKDDMDAPTGYFGLEGFYNRELSGRVGLEKEDKDASGNPLLISTFRKLSGREGRDLTLNMERSVQHIVESELAAALVRYGASAGEVIVMDPNTGGILAMASLPNYQGDRFGYYDTSLYKNPSIANSYEPGSTFKVLVAAAAFNEGAITKDDKCDICGGPLPIDKYFIKTWDGTYRPGATPEDIIVHSDNTGMVWMQRKLGGEKMVDYLTKFGIGQKTGIDLQEEVAPPFRSKWGEIDYATSSFGQGIAVTSIQMITAVSAIANGGKLMEPHVVKSVGGDKGLEVVPKVIRTVISPDAATEVKDLMVAAVEKGEAQWTKIKGYKVAGKTGTAQIAVDGYYDAEKTIASFVGFAPADNPRFVMITKLREPTTSIWGSETAAPLFFKIARRLFLHYNIAPTQ